MLHASNFNNIRQNKADLYNLHGSSSKGQVWSSYFSEIMEPRQTKIAEKFDDFEEPEPFKSKLMRN